MNRWIDKWLTFRIVTCADTTEFVDSIYSSRFTKLVHGSVKALAADSSNILGISNSKALKILRVGGQVNNEL